MKSLIYIYAGFVLAVGSVVGYGAFTSKKNSECLVGALEKVPPSEGVSTAEECVRDFQQDTTPFRVLSDIIG